jgi:hypothetical protein
MPQTKAQDFDFNLFHDSTIVAIDFSNWLESISMTFFCPHGGGQWEDSRFYRIEFRRVLCFGFEVQCLGEFGGRPPFVSNVILQKDSEELTVWRRWIDELATPSPEYPRGMKSPDYTQVYHFVLDSVEFRGRACLPEDRAFQIICRDFNVVDVTTEMPPDTSRYVPPMIESE